MNRAFDETVYNNNGVKANMVKKPSMLIYFLESDDSGEIYTTDALLPGNKIYGLTGGWGLSDGPFILPSWHNGNPNQLHFDGHVAKNIYGALAGSLTVQGSVYWRLGADISSLR